MKLEVNSSGDRIDLYISSNSDYSRSKLKKFFQDGKILVNGSSVKPSYKVLEGDIIDIIDDYSVVNYNEPENIHLDILYEDRYLAIINKQSGLVVHPAVGNLNHTLVNALLYHFNSISNNGIRPGIVHRLDKDTSGVMVVAKDDKVHEALSLMIKEKKIERTYLALVWGNIRCDKGTIDAPIGRDINNRQKYTVTDINSKDSITHFNVLERLDGATLISCKLDTGRTHQIRVHLSYIGNPVVNDPVYCSKKLINKDFGQMLHSKSIRFIHPVTGEELYFEAEPPKEFIDIVNSFRD